LSKNNEDNRNRNISGSLFLVSSEGKFGPGKNSYRLDKIKAKTTKTSEAWIRSIFFVMNLVFFKKVFSVLERLTAYFTQNRQIRGILQEIFVNQRRLLGQVRFSPEMVLDF
jgi:hypothetical protein